MRDVIEELEKYYDIVRQVSEDSVLVRYIDINTLKDYYVVEKIQDLLKTIED